MPLRIGSETTLPLVSARTSTWRAASVRPRRTTARSISPGSERSRHDLDPIVLRHLGGWRGLGHKLRLGGGRGGGAAGEFQQTVPLEDDEVENADDDQRHQNREKTHFGLLNSSRAADKYGGAPSVHSLRYTLNRSVQISDIGRLVQVSPVSPRLPLAFSPGRCCRKRRFLRAGGESLANNDSFINEVTEEVRRDRLFALFRPLRMDRRTRHRGAGRRRGGQTSISRPRRAPRPRALGNALIAALEAPTEAARAEALSAVEGDNPRTEALVALLEAGTGAAEADRLWGIAENPDLPALWRDVAGPEGGDGGVGRNAPPAELIDRLEPLALPGAPYRLLRARTDCPCGGFPGAKPRRR